MIHSYSTEVAIEVGGVSEAVVLKEVAYWCKLNESKGANKHDGRFWAFRPLREWQEIFPEFKGSIAHILQRLQDGGWLISGNFNKTEFDRTRWYTLSDKAISLLGQIDLTETPAAPVESEEPAPVAAAPAKPTPTEKLKKEYADEIERLYKLYPGKSKTRTGVRSTGKCSKDKMRLAQLLKTHTPEQIERSITKYLEEQEGMYLKNFSTFLNNLPEYEEDNIPVSKEEMDEYAHYQ